VEGNRRRQQGEQHPDGLSVDGLEVDASSQETEQNDRGLDVQNQRISWVRDGDATTNPGRCESFAAAKDGGKKATVDVCGDAGQMRHGLEDLVPGRPCNIVVNPAALDGMDKAEHLRRLTIRRDDIRSQLVIPFRCPRLHLDGVEPVLVVAADGRQCALTDEP
jgi:hypothetical protein